MIPSFDEVTKNRKIIFLFFIFITSGRLKLRQSMMVENNIFTGPDGSHFLKVQGECVLLQVNAKNTFVIIIIL